MSAQVVKIEPDLISYRALRKWLGWFGVGLPIVLIVGQAWVMHGPMKGSLSAYYHTGMRNWFVGSLCAMAVFLACYRGYDGWENTLTNLAGFAALGVAFCHTAPETGVTDTDVALARLHIISAAVLFVALTCMAAMFARDKPKHRPKTPERELKRKVYIACAVTMALCIGLMAILGPIQAVAQYRPVLWLESLTIIAFGVSWLVKGLVPRQPAPPDAVAAAPGRPLPEPVDA